MTLQLQDWWWKNPNQYQNPEPLPQMIRDLAGPNDVALVKTYDTGQTDPGWGDAAFMLNYNKHKFAPARALAGYEKGRNHFAIVMRSVKLICVDIDGKNGGIEHAAELLGNVPYTLAETSKSGNGYHLYFTYEDEWNEASGFGELTDAIGIVQGVDIRATGCVYHYKTQRWNNQPIAELPSWIETKLKSRLQARNANIATVVKTAKIGGWEALMQIQELIDDLAKPIDAGRRNNTLFAIGSKLMLAGDQEWEEHVSDRAQEVGLDMNETNKLISNISKYGNTVTV